MADARLTQHATSSAAPITDRPSTIDYPTHPLRKPPLLTAAPSIHRYHLLTTSPPSPHHLPAISGTGDFDLGRLHAEGANPVEMARRILRGMFMANAFAQPVCSVGQDCWPYIYEAMATTSDHADLAHEIAIGSAVLLKNDGGVLPIAAGKRVALLGPACDARHQMWPASASWDEVGCVLGTTTNGIRASGPRTRERGRAR